MNWSPRSESLKYEEALMRAYPHIQWCDFDSHGYNIVDVTPERMQVEYWHVDTVLERTKKQAQAAVFEIKHGTVKAVKVK